MAGLIFILPILAFDIWLLVTTGRRQVERWRSTGLGKNVMWAILAGTVLGVWLTFFERYGSGIERRQGFPVPLLFFRPEANAWSFAAVPMAVIIVGGITNFFTGMALPFIPYKIAEFIRQVKEEVK